MKGFKFFEVGGAVRDELLGINSKDIDFTVVHPAIEGGNKKLSTAVAFVELVTCLELAGFEIFLVTPECFTIRAKFPKGDKRGNLVADFVLARKDVFYPESGRIPEVELGDLFDDLKRRDFTVNAIAKSEDGTFIDPFGGRRDLKDGILRTPVDARQSFNDDPLRILRALRFSVTKELGLSDDIRHSIRAFPANLFKRKVSEERIREELYKMFKHDTLSALRAIWTLHDLNGTLWTTIFTGDVWLMPTNRK